LAGVQGIRIIGGTGGDDAVNITGGSYLLDASTPAAGTPPNVAVTVGPGQTAMFDSDQRIAALTVDGGSVDVVSTQRKTLSAGALSIVNGGRLDLGLSDLLVSATPSALIRSYLCSAYTANGDWSGASGITSGLARTNSILYTLGFADGSDASAQDASITTATNHALAANELLVRLTLAGDANLDGRVDFFDLTQLLGHKYNTNKPSSYADGDLNYDGKVDSLISRRCSAPTTTPAPRCLPRRPHRPPRRLPPPPHPPLQPMLD
jgi:hypothetical protein